MTKQTVLLSRSDFVGSYIGWTEIKTQQILEANRDNKIIIGSAYVAVNEKDLYGQTALNKINQYIRDNPDVDIVIQN